jgi:hypothetical protein
MNHDEPGPLKLLIRGFELRHRPAAAEAVQQSSTATTWRLAAGEVLAQRDQFSEQFLGDIH